MKQNKYDDPEFFRKYSEMPRSTGGLEEAGEWPAFRALLPPLEGKRVLDLGCGFGWHCRFAAGQGARRVVGVDLSEKMLARASEATRDPRVSYVRCAIEDIDFQDNEFDVAVSSLALHYVAAWEEVCARVWRLLVPGGFLVFSVEHPIFTSTAAQQWCTSPEGARLHWPVDGYQREGARRTPWLSGEVIKYHRTMASYVNGLSANGFRVLRAAEPEPDPGQLAAHPDWADEGRRPMFLIVAAQREQGNGVSPRLARDGAR